MLVNLNREDVSFLIDVLYDYLDRLNYLDLGTERREIRIRRDVNNLLKKLENK